MIDNDSNISAPISGVKVLMVEDDLDSANALVRLLQRYGHIVRLACSVDSAIQCAADEPFDIIICDIMLPDGNGYDLMKIIRSQFGLKGIALSGRGMAEDLLRSRQAGFNDHLTKPVAIETLDAAIREVVAGTGDHW